MKKSDSGNGSRLPPEAKEAIEAEKVAEAPEVPETDGERAARLQEAERSSVERELSALGSQAHEVHDALGRAFRDGVSAARS
jgi:hypothetical protein